MNKINNLIKIKSGALEKISVYGLENDVSGIEVDVYGRLNLNSGLTNQIYGHSNTGYGDINFVAGTYNKIQKPKTVKIGCQTSLSQTLLQLTA